MCRKLRNASATSLGSIQYKLIAALNTATPLANSSSATVRSACSLARCSLLCATCATPASLLSEFIGSFRRIPNTGTELRNDLLRCSFGRFVFAHIERNRPTRAWPPPPYRSHTLARFTTGGDGAQGFDPTETLTRKLLLLRPTLYIDSGCR